MVGWIGDGWSGCCGRRHCSHTFGAHCSRDFFISHLFFLLPFADVRRGARLLSPSPGTATLAQLHGPPHHSAPRPRPRPPPSLGSIGFRGVGKVCCHALSGRLEQLPLAHVARRTLQGFCFFPCRSRKRSRWAGAASRGASSCFPVDHFISITGQKFEGRAAD